MNLPPVEQDQLQSDNVLEDVACMLGCTRSSLHGASLAACCYGSKEVPASMHRDTWHVHGSKSGQ